MISPASFSFTSFILLGELELLNVISYYFSSEMVFSLDSVNNMHSCQVYLQLLAPTSGKIKFIIHKRHFIRKLWSICLVVIKKRYDLKRKQLKFYMHEFCSLTYILNMLQTYRPNILSDAQSHGESSHK